MTLPHAITLRPARPSEARTLAEMSRDLIETGLPWRYTPRRMAALIGDPESITLVATDGKACHGFAVMQFGDDQAHLALLAVRPRRQRCGIGSGMIEWLTASARVAGIAAITLEVRADNEGTLAFYRRLGFTQSRLMPHYYSQHIGARRMVRVLHHGSLLA